jgi:tetratricopeptide (TPR) repeat protein
MRLTAGPVVLGLLLVLCGAFCLTELSEVDLHWHLLTGSRILDEGHVPRLDDLSYTSAGRPWIDLQWLFEVAMAMLYRLAGWNGLDLLKILLLTGAFAFSMRAALESGAGPTAVALVSLPALISSQERFTLRPEAASFLMLSVLLWIVGARRRAPRRLRLVPPLLGLWANLHSLFAVGIAALVVVAIGDGCASGRAARRGEGGEGGGTRRALLIALAASLPLTLVNPYGISGWTLPWRLLADRIATQNVYARSIAEFQAPFSGFGTTSSVLAFAFLSLLVITAWSVAGRGRALSDALLLLVFFGLALLARRNIPLFALTAIPAGAPAVQAALVRLKDAVASGGGAGRRLAPWGGRALQGIVAGCALLTLAGVVTNRYYARDATQRYFGRGEAPGFYPQDAADFVLAASPPGQVLNDMNVGGYLAWRWFPKRRIFIDGRLEVHDRDLFSTYLRLQNDPAVFEEVSRRYDIDVVLWSHGESPYAGPLLRYLASHHGWSPVFIDLSAAVFMRDSLIASRGDAVKAIDPDDSRLLDHILDQAGEAGAASARRDPLSGPLRRWLPRRDVPVAEVSAALFFGSIGSTGPAERLLRMALGRSTRNPVLQYDLGLVLDASGRRDEARRRYELALAEDGAFAAAHEALARVLARSGDPDGAVEQWRLAERQGPLPPAALEERGRLQAASGRIDEAIEDYRLASRQLPRRGDLRSDLALLYLRAGRPREALEEIDRALALDPHGTAPRAALARFRLEEGKIQEAEQGYREILRDDPSSAEAHLGLARLLARTGRPGEALDETRRAMRSGLDPALLSGEPELRMLVDRNDLRVPPADSVPRPERKP